MPTAWTNPNSVMAGEATQYFDKITRFGQLTDYQSTAFAEYLKNHPKATPESIAAIKRSVELQKATLWTQIEELKSLYDKIFIQKTATKEERKALVYQESNLSIAIHRQLVQMHEFVRANNKASSLFFAKRALKLSQGLDQVSMELKDGKSIAVPASMGINQVFQSGQNLSHSLCSLIAGFCTRASLSKLMDSLNEKNFLRAQGYEFDGIADIKKSLDQHPKAVFILIGNHDQPLMDIALARKASLLLGSEKHITMTRKSVYPIPPPETAGDVVFVVDNDPKSNPVQKSLDLLSQSILDQKNGRVSLAVYPEGMLPYTGGQMPMTVKEGAFVIARKLAHQLSAEGIPVYLVQMKTNIIEHLTDVNTSSAKVVMERLERVPDTALDRQTPDLWIEQNRLRAENSFNSHRGESQIDIFNLDKAPSSKIPYGLEMKSCSKVFIL